MTRESSLDRPKQIYVLSPALNEEETVFSVVEEALKVPAVEAVVVVDNGSVDKTANEARRAGATVVSCAEIGKAQAVREGFRAIRSLPSVDENTDVVVLLDADLRGLNRDHIEILVAPLASGSIEMVCGHLGRSLFPRFLLPVPLAALTGQRAMTFRALAGVDWHRCKGYFLEVRGLNQAVASAQTERVLLRGVTHTRREQKANRDWAAPSRLPRLLVGPWIRVRVAVTYLGLVLYSLSRFACRAVRSVLTRPGRRALSGAPPAVLRRARSPA